MTWLLSEDAAIKFKLQGLVVNDVTSPPGGRPIGVRYRLPENEVADLSYPVIVIEHAGLYPAPEREHRGFVQLPYAPEGMPAWWDDTVGIGNVEFDPNASPYYTEFPIPYNFDYVITFYSRLSHFHMMPVVQTLAGYNYLPYHFGYLDIPQDGTKRTMQLMGGPEFGYENDNDGKRRYYVTYRVRVFSELLMDSIYYLGQVIPPGAPPQLTIQLLGPATSVVIDLSTYEDVTDLSVQGVQESVGVLSAGSPLLAWNVNIPPVLPEAGFPAQHIRRSLPRVPSRASRRNL